MGCISSKQAVSAAESPAFVYSVARAEINGPVSLPYCSKEQWEVKELEVEEEEEEEEKKEVQADRGREIGGRSLKGSFNSRCSLSFRVGNFHKSVEAEQLAAGWPAWFSAVASEAIQGWVPLRPDSFEKLEKIGQGTYSSVFRARDVESGRIVALKKVRFDNFQPESIRFMAREIIILRRLDHPNIMKLGGLITSRLSSSIYLVFEYMEHDLAGLLSCPDIKFSESQIKCYMQQLLCAIEHFHLRGIMHRDIKASNILVNNEGILKVADFGLANFLSSRHRQQLTSRVVTLWYRPPELLMGSTNYGVSVDLWSVGCLFAELLLGKPILKGRTEVEQLHKIFRLCGSPPEEYWKKSKLPHATMFKPHLPYESSLRERCKQFPTTAVNLIETLLSIDPQKRGTASSALMSEYFTTEPYACDPSSLPKYPPNKEIDAKSREEARRKKEGVRTRASGASRNPRRVQTTLKEPNISRKLPPKTEMQTNTQFAYRKSGGNAHITKGKGGATYGKPPNLSYDTVSQVSQVTGVSQGDILFSGPLQVPASSGFAWAKRQKEDVTSTRSYSRSSSRRKAFSVLDPSILHDENNFDSKKVENEDILSGLRTISRGRDSYKIARHAIQKKRTHIDRPDSFDASNAYHSQELSVALYDREETASLRSNLGFEEEQKRVGFSGTLLSQSDRLDERLQRHENHIRQALRKSRLQRES